MCKLDIVLQGKMYPYTQEIVNNLLAMDWVSNVILSVFEGDEVVDWGPRVKQVFNQFLSNPGTGNRNLQLVSSARGLEEVREKYCAKMRTDQIISQPVLQMMYDYWIQTEDPENRTPEPGMPLGHIYVVGLYSTFPYHPRDHVFWGFTEDVKKLCSAPFDPMPNEPNYAIRTRAETYIGQYYYAAYDPEIQKHVDNPLTYTVDSAPLREEAMAKDREWKDRLFRVWPRVEMAWPKHNLPSYHFEHSAGFGEYWAD